MSSKIQRPPVIVKIVIGITSMLIALFLAEITFRFYLHIKTQRDIQRMKDGEEITQVDSINLGDIVKLSTTPDLIFELKPNLRGKYADAPFSTNASGLRSLNIPEEKKPPRVLRIIGLGDSYMFGQGVTNDETYLAVLQKKMLEANFQVEVINFAVPGYNTTMEAAMLESRAVHFNPDIIIIGVTGNDWDLPGFLLSGVPSRPLGSAILGAITMSGRHLKLVHTPTSKIISNAYAFAPDEVPKEYKHMVGFSGFENALEKIATIANKVHAHVVIFSDCMHSKQEVGCDFEYSRGEREHLWRRMKDEWHMEICNWKVPPGMVIEADDLHPNPAAHRLIAAQLFDCVVPLIRYMRKM